MSCRSFTGRWIKITLQMMQMLSALYQRKTVARVTVFL